MSKNRTTHKHYTGWTADSKLKDFSRFLWQKIPLVFKESKALKEKSQSSRNSSFPGGVHCMGPEETRFPNDVQQSKKWYPINFIERQTYLDRYVGW